MSMKRLKKGEVFDVVAEANGLVFAFSNAQKSDDGEKPRHTTVYCKHYNYITQKSEMVGSDIFKLVKYGANYEKIMKYCTNYVMALAIILPDSKVFMINPDGDAFLFDEKGDPVWRGTMKYKNKVPNAITLARDGLWGSFPDFDAVVRFNPSTMRSELRLGKKGDLFACPKGIYAEDNYLYVSSYEKSRVIRVNLDDFSTEEIYTFKEPLYSYKKCKASEVVLLESGLYEIR